jgi:hypothetical protein
MSRGRKPAEDIERAARVPSTRDPCVGRPGGASAGPVCGGPPLAAQRPQHRARNDVPLHLAGSLPYALNSRIAPDPLERQV